METSILFRCVVVDVLSSWDNVFDQNSKQLLYCVMRVSLLLVFEILENVDTDTYTNFLNLFDNGMYFQTNRVHN